MHMTYPPRKCPDILVFGLSNQFVMDPPCFPRMNSIKALVDERTCKRKRAVSDAGEILHQYRTGNGQPGGKLREENADELRGWPLVLTSRLVFLVYRTTKRVLKKGYQSYQEINLSSTK